MLLAQNRCINDLELAPVLVKVKHSLSPGIGYQEVPVWFDAQAPRIVAAEVLYGGGDGITRLAETKNRARSGVQGVKGPIRAADDG